MRIITGRAKGLRLKTPTGMSTRPTSDRVKESVFDILVGLTDFAGAAVLDIFAGTGALGLEAMSRGAHSATFIDSATTEIIRDNILRAKFDTCRTLRGDFEKILRRLSREGATFDLIFSDPPYGRGLAEKSLRLVEESGLLSSGGLMIVEHGAAETSTGDFELVRTVIYGKTTAVSIFRNA